jgi:hypothetical protein
LLAGIGVYRLLWKSELPANSTAILRLALVGHTSALLFIITAMYLALRYRLDLAPFMTLASFVGYRSIATSAGQMTEAWRKRLRTIGIGLCILGILSSHYTLLLYKVWCLGVPMDVRLALVHFSPLSPF